MPNVTQYEAETTIAYVRGTLVDALAHRHAYNPWDHNICLAFISLDQGGGTITRELHCAYSHLSGLSKANLKKVYDLGVIEFVPDAIEFVGCGGMGMYHTEPRLLNYLMSRPGWIERVKQVTLVSEINCCSTCKKYAINKFRTLHLDIDISTIELGMNPGQGTGPQYKTI